MIKSPASAGLFFYLGSLDPDHSVGGRRGICCGSSCTLQLKQNACGEQLFLVQEPAAAGAEAAEAFAGARFAFPAERAESIAVTSKRPCFGGAFF